MRSVCISLFNLKEWINEFYYSNILSEETLLYDKRKLILTNMLCRWLHEISIKLDGSNYKGKVIAYNLIAFLAAADLLVFHIVKKEKDYQSII